MKTIPSKWVPEIKWKLRIKNLFSVSFVFISDLFHFSKEIWKAIYSGKSTHVHTEIKDNNSLKKKLITGRLVSHFSCRLDWAHTSSCIPARRKISFKFFIVSDLMAGLLMGPAQRGTDTGLMNLRPDFPRKAAVTKLQWTGTAATVERPVDPRSLPAANFVTVVTAGLIPP